MTAKGITPRQLEMLRMRCRGMTGPQIAARLFVSHKTVKATLTGAYERIGVGSLTDDSRPDVAKGEFACYLLGAADAAFILDPGGRALRPEQV